MPGTWRAIACSDRGVSVTRLYSLSLPCLLHLALVARVLWAARGKLQWASTFQASVCLPFANILWADANPKASLESMWEGSIEQHWEREGNNLGTFFATYYSQYF